MRVLLPFALACFGIGFAGARFAGKDAMQAQEKPAALIEPAPAVAQPEVAESSPAASQARLAAVFALAKNPRELAEDHALYLALQQLEAGDFPTSADELRAHFKKVVWHTGAGAALGEAWIERWLEIDSGGALRLLGSANVLADLSAQNTPFDYVPPFGSPDSALFKALARRQPAWTQQYLDTLPPGRTRELGAFLLLTEVAQHDAAKAKRWLASLGESGNRPAALRGFVAGLATADARAAFSLARAEPAGPLQDRLLESVLSAAAKRGSGTVQELLAQFDDPALRRKLAVSTLPKLSLTSREDLLPWIIEESRHKVTGGGWESSFDAWSRAVAEAVPSTASADWAATMEGDAKKQMLTAIIGKWTAQDAPASREWLGRQAASFDAATVEKLGSVMQELLRADPAATRDWAETLPASPLRAQVQFQIALSAGAKGDLAQATAVYESMASSDTKGELAKQLASVLAKQDGAAAAEWAMSRPVGPARAAAIASVAEQWSLRDPHGAAQWLGQIPAGAERDTVAGAYAIKVAFADPATAAEWVEQVADPAARTKTATTLFWMWKFENPVAARTWLRALPGLDEAWRTKILRNDR